jgi:hypothetical protein
MHGRGAKQVDVEIRQERCDWRRVAIVQSVFRLRDGGVGAWQRLRLKCVGDIGHLHPNRDHNRELIEIGV